MPGLAGSGQGRSRSPGRHVRPVPADENRMGVDPWEAEGARFRVLVEGMADAVAVLDRAAVLQYANPAAEALFGYRLAERRGRDILDLVHPEDLDLVVGSLGEMANIEV